MYSCPNVRTRGRIVPLDTSTPCHMRGPGFASGIFAIECAMDELAHALKMDPIELRRRNEPKVDEDQTRPFSSRSLMKCLDLGAEQFGWIARNPQPRSMKDGRFLVGRGVASASYPVLFETAAARARLLEDGCVEIEAAASDMGPGTYTVLAQVAAEFLGVTVEQVRIKLGRSDFPPTPPHGGSMTLASVGSAVREACLKLRNEIARRGAIERGSPLFDAVCGGNPIEVIGTVSPNATSFVSMYSFGAVFAEVGVDPDLGIVQVRRVLGVYSIGRIVNPLLATSQGIGGMVGGIGMAIRERTVLDPRDGRVVNAHMADYFVPVNLDVPDLNVRFVEEDDPYVNPLAAKGFGELALIGTAPAIANAIFHATGKRIRDLPVRVESLVGG